MKSLFRAVLVIWRFQQVRTLHLVLQQRLLHQLFQAEAHLFLINGAAEKQHSRLQSVLELIAYRSLTQMVVPQVMKSLFLTVAISLFRRVRTLHLVLQQRLLHQLFQAEAHLFLINGAAEKQHSRLQSVLELIAYRSLTQMVVPQVMKSLFLTVAT